MTAVLLEGIGVDVGDKRLIGPIDLAVDDGEHVLIAGPSGSGKTTLLRAIAGLARPSRGRVMLFGETASNAGRVVIAPEKRRIGFLFQGGALWPHMSARKQLEFVLKYSDVPREQRAARVTELLDWVELTGFHARMPATLSGGEAQRLALARALAAGPKLLLLDEPLGPLDFDLRAALLAKLGELQRRLKLTVIHVTHAPEEARAIATRVVRLNGGSIAAERNP